MRVAVVGAGVTGLVAAYRLGQLGHQADVYERWPGLGGQAATIDVGEGVLLERYYHHLFMSDTHIGALYRELGMPEELEWRPSTVAIFVDGHSHPFTTPLDLLRFKPLSPLSRVRMGLAVLLLQRLHRSVEPFEDRTARDWVQKAMGSQAYERVWGPLLRAKFGARADEISMAWLWSKLTLRRQIQGEQAKEELLGYPQRSWEGLYERLQQRIEAAGGRVLIDRPVAAVDTDGSGFAVTSGLPGSFRTGHDPRRFESRPQGEGYDAVLATVPSDVFEQLLGPSLHEAIGSEYLARLRGVEYYTALCVLMEVDRQVTSFYWTNICDKDVPFIGLIEHTNFVDRERYGGRRFLYVANYLSREDPMLDLGLDRLLEAYEPGLKKVNAAFSPDWIKQAWRFQEPAAQPIVTTGYQRRIPPLATGVPGLVLANTTQVYPEDRGTNYAVRLGEQAARVLASHADPSAPSAQPAP